MIKKLLQLNRDYNDAKEKAVEETVNHLESKNNFLYAVLFLILTILVWSFGIIIPFGLEQLYNVYGFYPIIIFFIISYFTLFLGSRIIFKPTVEELEDDTSLFALFSACRRKASRSLISIGLSLFHTLLFVFYLVSKDVKLF